MKLYLDGHDYKYAVEQILLVLFPDERPEYVSEKPVGEDNSASVSVSKGEKFTTVSVTITAEGKKASGFSRAKNVCSAEKIETDRIMQKIIKLAFYRAAMGILPAKPVWGALTGVRPGTIVTKMLRDGATGDEAVRRMEREYFVSPERAALCVDTARASMAAEASLYARDVALYIGIPFCPTRCAYCSFVSQSTERSMSLIGPFLAVLRRELEATAEAVKKLGLRVVSVYVGGGTPTTLTAEQLTDIFTLLREQFDLSAMREFCVEAGRPDTVTEDRLRALNACGVDRISINPQTMADSVLAAIGRRHTSDDVRRAYAMTRKIFRGSVNMDLIAGLPGDTPETFRRTLDEIVAMEPENVTVHTLSLKKGTRITLEGTPLPAAEDVGKMLDYAAEALRGRGYAPYYLYRQKFMSGGFENVGWCRPGYESLYNIVIMEELATVIAMGGGASTKLVDRATGRIERVFNAKYPKEYIDFEQKTIDSKQKIADFYSKTDEIVK